MIFLPASLGLIKPFSSSSSTLRLDPSYKSSAITLSDIDLTASASGTGTTPAMVRATAASPRGARYYLEVICNSLTASINNCTVGIVGVDSPTNERVGTRPGCPAWRAQGQTVVGGATSGPTSRSWGTGDRLMLAFDLRATGGAQNAMYIGKNGVWFETPGGAASRSWNESLFPFVDYYPALSFNNNALQSITMAFSASDFLYAIPAGYQPFNG